MVAGADATARSETALVDAVPVGGFDVGKLFDVRDWVCVGECCNGRIGRMGVIQRGRRGGSKYFAQQATRSQ